MTDRSTVQISFRLTLELVRRLDAHAERLQKEQRGIEFNRSDVVKMLLTRALDREEKRK